MCTKLAGVRPGVLLEVVFRNTTVLLMDLFYMRMKPKVKTSVGMQRS